MAVITIIIGPLALRHCHASAGWFIGYYQAIVLHWHWLHWLRQLLVIGHCYRYIAISLLACCEATIGLYYVGWLPLSYEHCHCHCYANSWLLAGMAYWLAVIGIAAIWHWPLFGYRGFIVIEYAGHWLNTPSLGGHAVSPPLIRHWLILAIIINNNMVNTPPDGIGHVTSRHCRAGIAMAWPLVIVTPLAGYAL